MIDPTITSTEFSTAHNISEMESPPTSVNFSMSAREESRECFHGNQITGKGDIYASKHITQLNYKTNGDTGHYKVTSMHITENTWCAAAPWTKWSALHHHTWYAKDTLLDNTVFNPGQLLHHNVDETSNESGENPDEATDDPATDLQTSESLWHNPTTQEYVIGERHP